MMSTEKKSFGEKSDELLEKVGELAKGAVEDVKDTAGDVKVKTERAWDKLTKKN